MCTERKATGKFVLADFLCDNVDKCNKNKFKLVTRLSLNGKPSRLELEMKTRVNILKD